MWTRPGQIEREGAMIPNPDVLSRTLARWRTSLLPQMLEQADHLADGTLKNLQGSMDALHLFIGEFNFH